MLVFEQTKNVEISEFMYRFTHQLLQTVFQVTFQVYLKFILTELDPVKSCVAVLPEQIPVCFQLNVLVHVFGII